MLDVRELLSGGIEALRALNNVETIIHPIRFRLSSPYLPNCYDGSFGARADTEVFKFGQEKRDSRSGISAPLVVHVPRILWPQPGGTVKLQLRASVTVEFRHHAEQRIEHVTRTADVACVVHCS